MQRVTGLPEERVLDYEAQAELILRAALQSVMDQIARRVEASMPVLASVLVAADGEPPAEPPPGQPYVSPDDLASIPPLWQQAVEAQILPVVAQVFMDAAGRLHTSMVEASSIADLPSVGSLAAEQYLAQARNTFAEVGDDLWGTARDQLLEGFEQGESIPELAERLRQSANMTARRGVLVARTQVNEASNAGSFAVAQASGLQMKKEWIATPDLRTRPTHLAADGQRVDLNEPFIVGGFSAMFPAAPSLPPAERYNCRCTVGYVMPDRAPAQVKADDLQAKELAELPGTSGVPAEPVELGMDRTTLEARIALRDDPSLTRDDLIAMFVDDGMDRAIATQYVDEIMALPPLPPDVLPRLASPGDGLPAYGENPPSYVRPSLRDAKTPRQLRQVWQTEAQSITGFPFLVDAMPRGISMVTAREYAEGTLQMLAQFPGAKVDRIHWFDDATSSSYGQVRRGGHAIEFNMRYASEAGRSKFLAARRRDVAGWDDPALSTSWGVRNDLSGQGVVYHEFTHILDIENGREVVHGQIVPLLIRHAQREGVTDIDDLIKRRISSYATKNYQEMIAEAGTDVMVNGAAASALSRDIFDLVRAEYRRRGFEIRTAPIDELAAEAERFGKAAAPLSFEERLAAARKGYHVEDLAPIRVEVDASAGSDTGKWKALGAQGFTGAPSGLLSAVTRRVRVSGPFNEYLRFPEGRPLAEWEAKYRAGLTPEFRAKLEALDEVNRAKMIAAAQRDIRALDRAMAQSSMPSDVVVWRGGPIRDLPDTDAVGFEFLDPGYVGTTGKREIATSFGGVTQRILLPEGTPAISIYGGGEGELLLARGLRFRVVAERRTAAGARELDLEIVPSAPPVAPAAAPRALSAQTVGQLRALAKERGIAIPTGARKADLVKALSEPVAPLDEKAALRAAARERNRLIESSQGTAKLLAELDELIANKATKAAIRQRLDPALIAPEQVYAGADPAVVEALRAALDTGDPAKLRSTLTRAGTKTKLKPIGKAGAKAKFDPETMEGVGGIDIAADAQVIVVRRGTTLTLPDGSTLQLTRAQVTPIATKPAITPDFEARVKAAKKGRAATGATEYRFGTTTANANMFPDPVERIKIFDAFAGYRGIGSAKINRKLRAGDLSDTRIAEMDKAFSQSPLKADVVTYRGVRSGRSVFGQEVPEDLTGFEWDDPAFFSTSVSETVARSFVRDGGVLMRVVTPKGTHAVSLRPAAKIENPEYEILLDRGLHYRVVADHGRDVNGTRLIDVEVLPQTGKPTPVKAPRPTRAAAGARPAGVKARSTASYARLRGEARAVARQADIDAATGYGDAALRLDELVANGATERAITHAVDGLARQFGIKAADVERLRALVGQPEVLRATIREITGREGVEIVGATNDVVRFDRALHESIGAEIANGTPVQLVVPGSRIHLGREVITQHRARVQTTTRPLTQAEPPALAAAIGRSTPGVPYATRQAEVEQLAKRKPTDTRQLGGGATARTELEEFAGDQRAVRKTYGVRSPHQRKSDIGREADAEELAPEVVDAFGVRSAAVTRTGKDQILMEFVDGKTVAEEFPGYGYGTADQTLKISRPFTESDDGRMLGLADYIMGMGDRNEGNWIYRIRNGRVEITAIDHGFAFLDQRGLRPQSNFFSDFLQDEHNLDLLRSTIDVNPADLRVIRDRLEHLRQRFAEAGRKSWHDGMMRRLKALEQRADPNAPIRLAVT